MYYHHVRLPHIPSRPDLMNALKPRLIQFLQDELAIPAASVAIALRHEEPPSLLPIVLWQCELVTLEQLNKIFDWLETAS